MRKLWFVSTLHVAAATCLAAASSVAAARPEESPPLTFEDLSARALADPEVLRRSAEIASLDRDLAATGRFALEGLSIDGEVGPRWVDSGAREHEVSARIALPLLAGSGHRETAADALQAAAPDWNAAATVASRLRLRTAYLDAWVAQERADVLERQAEALGEALASVRERVAAGADAPYEAALVEGEALRTRTEQDKARADLGAAWGELRALAELPPQPVRLASPGLPDLGLAPDLATRFERGILLRSLTRGASVSLAWNELESARRTSRWTVLGSAGIEAEESFATLGAGYRIPRKGESGAIRAERDAIAAEIRRRAGSESDRLATGFRVAVDRAERFGEIVPPSSFDEALHAVSLRFLLGKEKPSEVIPVRRQLLEARAAALERMRAAHLLLAEIESLTTECTP